ncbi:MAG: discoidin domain-containing protein, partial [Planctomycetes bacterium]|nr:discoidin domain-containing protein [Planctomycetota bacterium]
VSFFFLVRLLIAPRPPRSEIWHLKSEIVSLLAWLAFCLLVAAFLVPFHLPYLRFQRELGFAREPRDIVEGSADLRDYIAVSETNKLYGAILPHPSSSECELFPGLVAVACAAFAVWRLRRSRLVVVYGLCALAALALSMGPTLKLWGHETLPGPYRLLGLFLPGYSGVRIPARFGIFFQLMLSVLAGLGLAEWMRGRSKTELQSWPTLQFHWMSRLARGCLVAVSAVTLAVLEYLAVPVPLAHVPVGKDMPEAYRWLARQPGDLALVEIPYGVTRLDAFYMYASTAHWKRLVNGASGYDPPERAALRLLMYEFPSKDSLEALRSLGVDYVVFHPDLAGREPGRLPDGLEVAETFGQDVVVKVMRGGAGVQPPSSSAWASPAGSTASASHAPERAHLALDGNLQTCWSTGVSQSAGMWFCLDLGAPRTLAGLRFSLGIRAGDFPKEYRLEGSLDGQRWQTLAEGRPWLQVLQSCFVTPMNPSFEIPFPVTQVRYLRITQTAKRFDYCWSIAEVGLLER